MTHEECERALAQAQGELAAVKDSLQNLLAVIHRDGGHYASEHGLSIAVSAAENIVLTERKQLAATSQENERLKEELQRCGVMYSLENALRHNVCEERDSLRTQLDATSQDILRAQVDQKAMEAMYTVLTFVWGQYPEMRHVLDALEEKYPTIGKKALTEPGGQP